MEYKQLPRGYAEVLENTQFALIATVHKLYNMVRNQQPWELGEPELNDRGQPVIHNIASKLGCIRPNSDMDLPVHSVFPEDEAGLAELARQLEEQQKEAGMSAGSKHETESTCNRTDRASSSELDHSDFEDYRKTAFGGRGAATRFPCRHRASLLAILNLHRQRHQTGSRAGLNDQFFRRQLFPRGSTDLIRWETLARSRFSLAPRRRFWTWTC